MPQYTVRDPETGRTVTFNWNGDQPPSDSDIAEVFAAAGPSAPGKSVSGFFSNALADIPNVPKNLWETAKMVARNAPFSPNFASSPEAQALGSVLINPKPIAKAALSTVTNPVDTVKGAARAVGDYAYNHPAQALLDASALASGGGAALTAAGKTPRLASALSTVGRATDPIGGATKLAGKAVETMSAAPEAAAEFGMRKALNMSDADVRVRPGVERTALENRIPATKEGLGKLQGQMAPIVGRQQAAIDAMPEFALTPEQLKNLNALVDDTARIKGSDPARYNAAVQNRTEALIDPNFTADKPVIDGLPPTEGRYPAPIPGRLLHENKQALQQRASELKAYTDSPQYTPQAEAVSARASDYKGILDAASPEYAAANAELSPLMALQEQLKFRALPRGGREIPYGVGFGLQAARGNVVPAAVGMLSGLALKNPRLASAIAQGSFDVGRGLGTAGQATQIAAPSVNQMNALQQAIMRLTRDEHQR